MKPYIDIHSHILPNIDDGAKSFEMSLRMLGQAAEDDISDIILTPHYKPMRRNLSPETVIDVYEELERKKEAAGIKIRLHLGNEIYYSSEAVTALTDGKAFTLADSPYVLTEFSPREDYAYIRDAAYNLLAEGYIPILAHIERYNCLMEKKIRVGELYDMGCYLQINAASIVGDNGMDSKRNVKWLLKQGYVHFVASDCHDDTKRTPRLSQAASYVSRKYGEAYCDRIFRDNAEALLHGNYI